jgi:hypothetical protein
MDVKSSQLLKNSVENLRIVNFGKIGVCVVEVEGL